MRRRKRRRGRTKQQQLRQPTNIANAAAAAAVAVAAPEATDYDEPCPANNGCPLWLPPLLLLFGQRWRQERLSGSAAAAKQQSVMRMRKQPSSKSINQSKGPLNLLAWWLVVVAAACCFASVRLTARRADSSAPFSVVCESVQKEPPFKHLSSLSKLEEASNKLATVISEPQRSNAALVDNMKQQQRPLNNSEGAQSNYLDFADDYGQAAIEMGIETEEDSSAKAGTRVRARTQTQIEQRPARGVNMEPRTPFPSLLARSVGQQMIAPLVDAKLGQRVELACHMFGRPSEASGGERWPPVEEAPSDANEAAVASDGSTSQVFGSIRGDDKRPVLPKYDLVPLGAPTIGLVDVDDDGGGSAELNEEDLVSLVFWYKDDNPTPIYTLDARQVPLTESQPSTASSTPPAAVSTAVGAGAVAATTVAEAAADKSRQYGLKQISSKSAAAHRAAGGQHGFNTSRNVPGSESSRRPRFSRFLQRNKQLLAGAKHYQAQPSSSSSNGKQQQQQQQQRLRRLRLDTSSHFPVIKLIIEEAWQRDSGLYRCRIDFRRARTIRQLVRLQVKVPISRIEISIGGREQPTLIGGGEGGISDHGLAKAAAAAAEGEEDAGEGEEERANSGQSTRLAEPPAVLLAEGEQAEFTCFVLDGSPKPKLSWLVKWSGAAGGSWSEPEELVPNVGAAERLSGGLAGSVDSDDQSDAAADDAVDAASGTVQVYGTTRVHSTNLSPSKLLLQQQRGQTNESKNEDKTLAAIGDLLDKHELVRASRLRLAPLGRPFHRTLLGCRARLATVDEKQQQCDLRTGENCPNYRQSSSITKIARSAEPQSADWRPRQQQRLPRGPGKMIDDPVTRLQNNESSSQELTKWFELKLTLKPERIEIVSEQVRPELEAERGSASRTGASGSEPTAVWLAEVNEFERLRLVCRSSGSNPAAQLRWAWAEPPKGAPVGAERQQWRQPLAATDNASTSDCSGLPDRHADRGCNTRGGSDSSNLLELASVTSRHHQTRLTCTATNENLPPSVRHRSLTATVKLFVKFKPAVSLAELPAARGFPSSSTNEEPATQSPSVVPGSSSLATASTRQLKCQVQSNPPINQLVWLVNGQPLARIMAPEASSRLGSDEATSAPSASARAGSAAPEGRPPTQNSPPPGEPLEGPIGQSENSANSNQQERKLQPDSSASAASVLPSSWRIVPLSANATDGSKYRFAEANSLTVMNLTKFDSKDEYKCLAINIMGETSSAPVQLSVNYRPLCSGRLKQQAGGGDLFGLSADQVWQVAGETATLLGEAGNSDSSQQKVARLACQLDAQPAPTRFFWSFVPLDELVKLIASRQLQQRRRRHRQRRLQSSSGSPSSGSGAILSEWAPTEEGDDGEDGTADDTMNEKAQNDSGALTNEDANSSELLLLSLNRSARLRFETKQGELKLAELSKSAGLRATAEMSANEQQPFSEQPAQYGLLLCRALNQAGWQRRPCANLILPQEWREPSASNCNLEATLQERPEQESSPVENQHKQEQREKHIAISVDCSRAQDNDKLLFQLAISRRDAGSRARETADGRGNATSAGHVRPTGGGRPILFSGQREGGRLDFGRRIPISELLEWSEALPNGEGGGPGASDESEAQNDQEAALAASSAERKTTDAEAVATSMSARRREKKTELANKTIMTLDEQVELLNELVFTIRASNLIATSESRAIYGSELRLRREEPSQQDDGQLALVSSASLSTRKTEGAKGGGARSPGSPQPSTGVMQVSRSTSLLSEMSLDGLDTMVAGAPMTTMAVGQLGNGRRNSSSTSHTKFGGAGSSSWRGNGDLGSALAGWSHRHEISITIAAVCGTLVLSLLTLTLIVLVLKGRRVQNSCSVAIDRSTASAYSRSNNKLASADRPRGCGGRRRLIRFCYRKSSFGGEKKRRRLSKEKQLQQREDDEQMMDWRQLKHQEPSSTIDPDQAATNNENLHRALIYPSECGSQQPPTVSAASVLENSVELELVGLGNLELAEGWQHPTATLQRQHPFHHHHAHAHGSQASPVCNCTDFTANKVEGLSSVSTPATSLSLPLSNAALVESQIGCCNNSISCSSGGGAGGCSTSAAAGLQGYHLHHQPSSCLEGSFDISASDQTSGPMGGVYFLAPATSVRSGSIASGHSLSFMQQHQRPRNKQQLNDGTQPQVVSQNDTQLAYETLFFTGPL